MTCTLPSDRVGGERGEGKTLAKIHDILKKLSRGEGALRASEFVAPCVPGEKVRARVEGLWYAFTPRPEDFEGWGIFLPESEKEATLAGEADPEMISQYLAPLVSLRVRLAHPLRGKTWLAWPVNEEEAARRCHARGPLCVHLVGEAGRFDQVLVRAEGSFFWYEKLDHRDDIESAERLRLALSQNTSPHDLRFSGLTPEMRAAYTLAFPKR